MSDNTAQAELWNGRMGTAWVSVEETIDSLLEPLTRHLIDAAAPAPGKRILDIGCGCGTTSLTLAHEGAHVWGVDISTPMIDQANSKVDAVDGVKFSVADAATQTYMPDQDVIFSRFGVMFFADPIAAFRNIRLALKPKGKLVFLCWQSPPDNPWISVPGAAVAPFQPDDLPVPEPRAPGPFAFADKNYCRQMLIDAGFSNVKIQPVKENLYLGDTLDEAMVFQSRVGPLSALLETVDEATAKQASDAVKQALAPFLSDTGLMMPAATWLVTADNS